MTENKRGFFLDIPRHNIARAYAACPGFDECIAWTGLRDRNFLDADIVKRIKPCYLQCFLKSILFRFSACYRYNFSNPVVYQQVI